MDENPCVQQNIFLSPNEEISKSHDLILKNTNDMIEENILMQNSASNNFEIQSPSQHDSTEINQELHIKILPTDLFQEPINDEIIIIDDETTNTLPQHRKISVENEVPFSEIDDICTEHHPDNTDKLKNITRKVKEIQGTTEKTNDNEIMQPHTIFIQEFHENKQTKNEAETSQNNVQAEIVIPIEFDLVRFML